MKINFLLSLIFVQFLAYSSEPFKFCGHITKRRVQSASGNFVVYTLDQNVHVTQRAYYYLSSSCKKIESGEKKGEVYEHHALTSSTKENPYLVFGEPLNRLAVWGISLPTFKELEHTYLKHAIQKPTKAQHSTK